MKRLYIYAALATTTLVSASTATAQDFDTKPTIKLENEKEDLTFTVGARLMSDVAFYSTDYTPMNSGAAITDARLRTSLTFKKDWYFYADFDFSGGKVTQKNIYMQYSHEVGKKGTHSIRAGYFNDPSTMNRNTSLGSLHFISRPSSTALAAERELGVSYKYYTDKVFLNQGVFAENKYNDQAAGSQGITLGGRWIYRPINDEKQTLHVGAIFRYANINTGTVEDNVKETNLSLSTGMNTYVDKTAFLDAEIPWAKNVYTFGGEALYRNPKFFVRGEYRMMYVTKERDDVTLFNNQLGGTWSWTTLESWQAGNPLGDNNFQSGYIEAGYRIFGKGYSYDNSEAVLGGFNGKGLEVVARYDYTNLNDLVDGELYVAGRDQYYPNGVLADYPATSKSIGGGSMHSVTVGLNYSFNRFAHLMVDYTYSRLDRDKYQYDKNFHTVQARMMFNF